ncbi:hypothetical protein ES703_75386 [subsurface metagenome]
MVEYRLDVKADPRPESRLMFFRRLEECLRELREEGIIGSFALSTPYGSTIIFKVKEEASS